MSSNQSFLTETPETTPTQPTQQPNQRRVRRCGACGEPGHDRRTCQLPQEIRRRARAPQQLYQQIRAEQEALRRAERTVHTLLFYNCNDYPIILLWIRDSMCLDQEVTAVYMSHIDSGENCDFRSYSSNVFVAIHQQEIVDKMNTMNENGFIKLKLSDYQYHSIIEVSKSLLPDGSQQKEFYLEPKPYTKNKTELEKWKECGIKCLFLLHQLNKLGVSNNDNYACIMDMVQDIAVPEITEFDKELAGVPSTFTNVT
tara:strand:- start:353 stop:1120 length:768 start_codon:yes stop_codon:yes gene_type:complete